MPPKVRPAPKSTQPPGPTGISAAGSGQLWLLAVLLVGLVVAAYVPALQGGFIWDDDKYVTANPLLTDTNGLHEIWFTAHTQSQYFPLVFTTLRLEHGLWGLNPLGYHLVNVLLHGVNAVLVWLVLRRLRVPGAWLAAALFGLHPVNVESVAWVTELKNVESLFFYLLAVLGWVTFLDRPGPERWRFYGLALAAGLLALFAKTTACTLPVALVLIVWLRRERFTAARAGQIVPFVLAGILMGLVSIWWEGNLGTYNDDAGPALTGAQRWLLAGRALWFYAGKLVWPAPLTFSYPHWDLNPASLIQYVPLLGLGMVAAGLWWWRVKIGRGPLAGVIFFSATLTPLLGFITDYTFRYSYVADHYQYVAAIGLFAVVAAGAARLPGSARGWTAGTVLVVLGALTWHQCGAYRNIETLWQDTLAKNPGSWMAHYNLGMELQDQGRIAEAMVQFRTTIALHPEHVKARNNLAVALAKGGNYYQAVAELQQAVKLDPDMPSLWMNLGGFLETEGRVTEAATCYEQAAARFPTEAEPWRRLGDMALDGGQEDAAAKDYQAAVQRAPGRTDLLLKLGNAYAAGTNYLAAIGTYRQILKLEPDNAGVHYNLAVMLLAQGEVEPARQELRETLRRRSDFAPAAEELEKLAR